MRRIILLLCIALPAFGQVRPPHRFPPEWNVALPAYEQRVRDLSAGIKRDAFIVAKITLAMSALTDDMQKMSAIQKAHDHIVEAQVRAGQDPPASPNTQLTLSRMEEALKRAREQGTMADLDALRPLMRKNGGWIQRDLFEELSVARGERQNLTDAMNKIQTMNVELEAAMIEALASTFDFLTR